MLRSPVQADNQRMEMDVYFFTFLFIQPDNAPRGRSPPVLGVSGVSALLLAVLLEPVTRCSIPRLHTHLLQHQLVMWCLKHQIFLPCLSTLQLWPVRVLCSTQNKHPNVQVNPLALWTVGLQSSLWGEQGPQGSCCGVKKGERGRHLCRVSGAKARLRIEALHYLFKGFRNISPFFALWCYEYSAATLAVATFWSILGRIDDNYFRAPFSPESCFFFFCVTEFLQERNIF